MIRPLDKQLKGERAYLDRSSRSQVTVAEESQWQALQTLRPQSDENYKCVSLPAEVQDAEEMVPPTVGRMKITSTVGSSIPSPRRV